MGKRGRVSLESGSRAAVDEVEKARPSIRLPLPSCSPAPDCESGATPAKPHPGIASCDMPRQSCEVTGGYVAASSTLHPRRDGMVKVTLLALKDSSKVRSPSSPDGASARFALDLMNSSQNLVRPRESVR